MISLTNMNRIIEVALSRVLQETELELQMLIYTLCPIIKQHTKILFW